MFREFWYAICTTCRPRHSSTVRYAFPFVALAVVLVGAAATITQNSSYITIEARPQTVRSGEVFFIDVNAVAHTPVNAIDIVLEYPEAQMRVTGVDTGESVITLWTEQPYAKDGKLYMRGGTFRKGFVGEHLIARVRAEAVESGTAKIETSKVTFIAGDGKGTEISVSDAGYETARLYISNEDGSLVGIAEVQIITDINGDGEVGFDDINAFMSGWRNKNIIYDFNGDGKMSFRDFGILLTDYFFK
jgi:hypothetical protein